MILGSAWVTQYEEMDVERPFLEGGILSATAMHGTGRIIGSPFSAKTIPDDRIACVGRRGAAAHKTRRT
jgi:hypothetical protein